MVQDIEQTRPIAHTREELAVGGLDDGDRLLGEAAAGSRDREPLDACIAFVRPTDDEAALLQGAQDLAGHHHVDLGVVGHLALTGQPAGGATVVGEPPHGRQQHELHMSE